jgi:hypothetical protein
MLHRWGREAESNWRFGWVSAQLLAHRRCGFHFKPSTIPPQRPTSLHTNSTMLPRSLHRQSLMQTPTPHCSLIQWDTPMPMHSRCRDVTRRVCEDGRDARWPVAGLIPESTPRSCRKHGHPEPATRASSGGGGRRLPPDDDDDDT